MITFSCPNCQATLSAPEKKVGARCRCKRCGDIFQVPQTAFTPGPIRVEGIPVRQESAEGDDEPSVGDEQPIERRRLPQWVLALAITVGVVLVLSAICVPIAIVNRQAIAVTAAAATADKTGSAAPMKRPAADRLSGEEMRFGDIGVTVVRGKVEAFGSILPPGSAYFHEPAYVVQLVIKNYNPNRVLEVGAQADVATAEDDVGNHYESLKTKNELGIRTYIVGQIPPGKTLPVRPDKPDEDVLVFDRPVPGASLMRLSLDASRYGGTGTIHVTIPFKQLIKLQVHADREWQDTGVDVIEESEVTITYKGSWNKGKVRCTGDGFSPADDPKTVALRQLREQWAMAQDELRKMAGKQIEADRARPGPVPQPQRNENDADYRKRVDEYKNGKDALNQRRTEARRQLAEAQARVAALNQNAELEERLQQSRRAVGDAPLMCLVAKFGANGTPFVPKDKIIVHPAWVGRLFLQANDKDLAENSGSLDVEITYRR